MKPSMLRIGSLCLVVWAVASAAQAAAPGLDGWAGVYKHRFPNAMADGEKYMSEDVLEIVPVSNATAYVRTRLEFANGHFCAFWGVARIEGKALVYRPKAASPPCELKLERMGGRLNFSDTGQVCRSQYCGARGALDTSRFSVGDRRPIRYMARLKASREYAEALTEAGLKSPAPPAAP